MKDFLLSLNHFFGTVPNALRRYQWHVLVSVFLISVFMAAGLNRFTLNATQDSWFGDDDPVLKALDDFRSQFGSDDGLYLVYEAKDGDVFSEQSLQLVRELTDELKNWQNYPSQRIQLDEEAYSVLAHIQRVQSLANIRIQRNQQDTLLSEKLVPNPLPGEASALKQIAQFANQQDTLPLFMFSKDHRFGAIMVQTDFGAVPKKVEDQEANYQEQALLEDDLDAAFDDFSISVDETAIVEEVEFEKTDSNLYLGFMTAVKATYEQAKYAEHFQFYPVGNSAMIVLAIETMVQAGMLMGLMVLVIVALLWTLFHSASAVVWPIVAIILSILWVLGAITWAGIAVTQLISLTVMLVLAVGVADCVHVMSTYLYYRRHDYDHEAALSLSYSKTGVPILLTSITTMAGMLALSFTGMQQFVLFGISSAAGVLMALLFTIFVLPLLMDLWHPLNVQNNAVPTWKDHRLVRVLASPFKALVWLLANTIGRLTKFVGINWLLSAKWLQPLLDLIPAFVQKTSYPLVLAFTGIFCITLYGAFQVRVDTNLVELYKEGTSFRETYKVVDKQMMGTGAMEVMLDFKASDAFMDPKVLQATDRLQQVVSEKYSQHIIRTNSLANLVKDTNKIINNDEPSSYTIPDDRIAVSQLLYLFNSANPEDRRSLVSDDYSRSHISIQLRNAGSYEYTLFFDQIQQDIQQIFNPLKSDYPEMKITVTGTLAMMMRLAGDISKNQFKSLTIAIVIISLLLMITLGSVQAGVLGIIPNLIPATLAFGLMGIFGIPLDADTLMIAPLIIGIAVDDTIHFITHYRMALIRDQNMKMALIDTIKEVGQAVTFTSLVLGCGFLMLSFSDYLGFAKIGSFGSLAIFVALLCDLLFLPALIMIFKPKFGQHHLTDNLHFHRNSVAGEQS